MSNHAEGLPSSSRFSVLFLPDESCSSDIYNQHMRRCAMMTLLVVTKYLEFGSSNDRGYFGPGGGCGRCQSRGVEFSQGPLDRPESQGFREF